MRVLRRFSDFLLYPFSHDFLFLLLMMILLGGVDVYYHVFFHSAYVHALYQCMMYYVCAYAVSLFSYVCGRFSVIVKAVFVCLSALWTAISIFCLHAYGLLVGAGFIEAFMGTNQEEAGEFLHVIAGWGDIVSFVCEILLALLCFCFTLRWPYRASGVGLKLPIACMVASVVGLLHNPGVIVSAVKDVHNSLWIAKYAHTVDLTQHLTHPNLEAASSTHPTHFVVIIGESFSRSHSSLYGYARRTNPHLEQKRDDGSLVVFTDVTAPAPVTVSVFKTLLSTCVGHVPVDGEDNWYEYTNAIEAFSALGYYTAWLSCQGESGLVDNIPSSFSTLCDYHAFDTRTGKERYDDFLIGAYQGNQSGQASFIVYHMLGQHPDFSARYPEDYCMFGPKNLKGSGGSQAEVLADYDNATLFNDYVVSSIMDLYANEEAIVIYVPDHGLDLFETDPTFFGHGVRGGESERIARQIPFVVYMTPTFQMAYPELAERIKAHVDRSWCTDKLIFTLLDVAGYKFADNDDVTKYSLFAD